MVGMERTGMERTRKMYEESEVAQIVNSEAYRTRIGVVVAALHHDLIRTNAPVIYIETLRDILADYGYPMEEPPQAPPQSRQEPRPAAARSAAAAPAGSDPDGTNERHNDVMGSIIGKGRKPKTE